MTTVGTSVRRREDPRLVRGRGRFVDDVDLPGQLHARVVRASVAHARIEHVDADAARALPGVRAVLTAADLGDVPRIPMRLAWTKDDLDHALQPVLAVDRVRYVGEPVAVVVAEDGYAAEDAAEAVHVSLEPLPCVVDARAAMEPDAPSLWEGRSNRVTTIAVGFGDTDAAFATAAHVVELDASIGRHTGVPLETRGIVARPDRMRDGLEVWGWTKVPHFNRRVLADLLGLAVGRIKAHSADAGGGFGIRGEFYPEDLLVPLLAWRLDAPVKWIEDRSEHLVAANHSRHQHHRLALALDGDGRILGLRSEVWHDNGGYLRTHGVTVPELTAKMLPGPYRVPAYDGAVHVVTTNKTPAGTYRGPGRYEVTFAREQLLNLAAARVGIDRIELRRRNLVRADEIPYSHPITVLGGDMILSSGDYSGLLDATLAAARFPEWEDEAVAARAEGRLVGTGIAFFLEKSGLGPYETAAVEVGPDGRVRVLTGGTSLGQGIETVLAQIAADELDVAVDAVDVVHGDTDLVPEGGGSWASRSTVVGGSAVQRAAQAVADDARRVGAHVLGVHESKVDLAGGRVTVHDTPAQSMSLGEVAAACDPMSSAERGEARGLRGEATFTTDRMNYPYGVHLAQVEIDRRTAGVRVLRYFVGYEVGRAINPQLVEGQLIGGVAQGLGGALMEELAYASDGQPLATTFLDYLLPTAVEVPHVGTLVAEDAAPPDNPLGVMGAGEGGCTGVGAAIANAVDEALRRPGAIRQLPVTPARLHAVMTTSDGDGRDG